MTLFSGHEEEEKEEDDHTFSPWGEEEEHGECVSEEEKENVLV